MRIDFKRAKQILEEEATAAATGPVSDKWIARIRKLEEACGDRNLTFLAALGTALLARATNPEVDVSTLKASTSERGYSARSLCKEVLAALAPRLGIDLGVTGREPLNNQPFFAEERITDALPIRPEQRPALQALLESLEVIEHTSSEEEARLALRTFLKTRNRRGAAEGLREGAGHGLTIETLAAAAEQFVLERSERGKRAQAVAAGLLDVTFGEARVVTGRVYDPDRHFPGDVAVRASEWTESDIIRVFEVRDKRVTSEDIVHFAVKVLERGIRQAGMIAVASGQADLDLSEGLSWARAHGLEILVYSDWRSFARHAAFWAEGNATDPAAAAFRHIHARLQELEVSREGIEAWSKIEGGYLNQ